MAPRSRALRRCFVGTAVNGLRDAVVHLNLKIAYAESNVFGVAPGRFAAGRDRA